MTEVEKYQAVTECREVLREPFANLRKAIEEALRIADWDQSIVDLAFDAEAACLRARQEIAQAA